MLKSFKLIFSVLSLFLLALLLINSKTISTSLEEGINICLYILIPSLFVFLVVSDLLIKTHSLDFILKPFSVITSKLFNIDKTLGPILFMSFMCGYPVGARLINDLVIKNIVSRSTGERLICYCMNAGPAFLIGSVSYPLFGSFKPGFYIFICHLISFFIVGIFSGLFKDPPIIKYKDCKISFACAIVNSVNGAIKSMASICAFVLLFCGIIGIIRTFPFINSLSDSSLAVIFGFLEVSNGVFSIESSSFFISFLIVTGITAFGGLCVHLQVKAAVFSSGIKLKKFYIYRLFYTAISVLFASIIFRFIDIPQEVFSSSDHSFVTSTNSPINSILLIILSLALLYCDKKSCIMFKKKSLKL